MLQTLINSPQPQLNKGSDHSTPVNMMISTTDQPPPSNDNTAQSGAAPSTESNKPVKKRVRTGCLNCRRKHKKCDEHKPVCLTCKQKNESCQWPTAKLPSTDIRKNLSSLNSAGAPLTLGSSSVNGLKRDIQLEDRRNSFPIAAPNLLENYTTVSNTVNAFNLSARPSGLIPSVQTNQIGLAQLRPLNPSEPQQQQQSYLQNGFLTYPTNGPAQAQTPLQNQAQLSMTSARRVSATSQNSLINQQPPLSAGRTSPPSSISTAPPMFISKANGNQLQPSMDFLNYTMNLDTNGYRRTNSTSPPPCSAAGSVGGGPPLNLLKFQIQPGTDTRNTFLQLQKIFYGVLSQSYNDSGVRLNGDSKLTNEAKHILLNHYINKIAPRLSLLNSKVFGSYVLNLAGKSPALMHCIYALSLQDFSQGNSIHPFNETPLTLFEVALHHLQLLNFQNVKVLTPAFLILTVLVLNMTADRRVWKETVQRLINYMSKNRVGPNVSKVDDSFFWLVVLIDINITEIYNENDKPLIQFDLAKEDFKDTNVENNEETIPKILTLLNSTINILNFSGDDTKDFNMHWQSLWVKTIQLYDLFVSSNFSNSVIFQYDTSTFPCMILTDQFTTFLHQNLYTVIILLLQNKPRSYKVENTEIRSITWYAKRACGISIANNGHSNWFNGEFCLYIAGKLLTHVDEHNLVLQCLNDLESQSLLGVVYHSNTISKYWSGEGV
ncbi:hypothetical protein WICPIJ_000632 [Wickerhamomyces pijperi]|uniref:Zn(2)-C6 fungal-type domain-containing protein n=1 Tax=Wickerhamomyces pijperi TaxID=599730 RepID=A0A9P8QGG3_WICPI|nr:hypothetical protein WICPIJ_000632 [Wickerhamomyces pijperi]